MITVVIYGLDQFVVGRLSREMSANLASLYEVKNEDIIFVAPSNYVFYQGVEQTSWNILIHVHAPKKFAILQKQVATFILKSIGEVAINKTLEFYYYSQDDRYEDINDSYPRFLKEDNLVNTYSEDYHEKEEGDEDDEIFTGDIFSELGK